MPTSKSCTIVAFAVSTSMSRTHDRTRLSPAGMHPSASEGQRRSSAHIASWARLSAVSRVDLDPSCGALGETVVDRIPRFCGVTSTRPGGTPVTEKRVRLLVGPLPVDTMNSVSVERRDWTGCTENSVGSGPKLMVRATAPLKRSVLLRTQYWTPRYDGFPLVHEEKSFAETMTTRSLNPRSGWSAQPVIVATRYEFQEPVGSSDADTSRRTLPVVTSAMQANQRPLAASKWTCGSPTRSGRDESHRRRPGLWSRPSMATGSAAQVARSLGQDAPLADRMQSPGWTAKLRAPDRRRREQLSAGPGGAMPCVQKEGEGGLKSTLEFDD